jgi:hypothetical protein
MNFKDTLSDDLELFFDDDEFAEVHILDGEEVLLVIDEDIYQGRESFSQDVYNASQGVYQSKVKIHVQSTDYERPVVGQQVVFDGEFYYVGHVSESTGVLSIELNANEA